ncbi:MAG: glycosyltransferase family 9 protein [Planctomycetes bacterium]|nr:glycosyltransferase family 9 protein [Planctomycetota bacterium]
MEKPLESVLALRLGGIGEVLSITPALKALRRTFPRVRVTLLAERPACEVAAGLVDEVIAANALYRANGLRSLLRPRFYTESVRLVEGLLRRKFDLFLDFHHLPGWRHVLKPVAIGILSRAPRRIGYDGGPMGFFLTEKAHDPPDRHMMERTRTVMARLGVEVTDSRPIFAVSDADRAWAASLGLDGPLVAVSPGASNAVKMWDVERFAEVARRLSAEARIVVTGSADERALCARVPGVNLAGAMNLGRFAALLERCRLLVSNDSGPVHIAYAVGTPVVGIFLPRAYREWGTYADAAKFRALYRDGPGAQRGKTLKEITVEEVVAAAREFLESHETAPRP